MLFTFHVSSGNKSYVAQHLADNWQAAKESLLKSPGFREFSEALLPSTVGAPIESGDVFLMVPMDGLKNSWLMQGGRAGEYFTAIIIQTDETGEVTKPWAT